MKLCVVLGVAFHAEAALHLKQRAAEKHGFTSALAHYAGLDSKPENRAAVHFGDTRCPCIGFDNIEGTTMVELAISDKKKKSVPYPADLGARCEAWDEQRHPACSADDDEMPGWCSQRWCIVDSCNCNLEVLPQLSVYMPTATYIGKPLFFSYATCGGKDFFTDPDGVPKVGKPKCRCIGFAGVEGETEVAFKDNKIGIYPSDLGAKCSVWDQDHHPACKGKEGKDAPMWCRANWCYVDPCGCELPEGAVPKISAYLPEATFTGKNLYYSYETCNSEDTWTVKHNKEACVNQDTEDKCDTNPRCAWTGKRCLGTELVNHPLCIEEEAEKKSGAAALASWTAALVAAQVFLQ